MSLSVGASAPRITPSNYRDYLARPSTGSPSATGGASGAGDGFKGSRDAQLEGDLEKRLQAVGQAQGQDREKAVGALKQAYDQAGGKNANISEDLKNKIEQALGGGQAGQPGGCGGAQGGSPQGGGGSQGGGCGQPGQGGSCGKGGQCGGGQPQEPYKASQGVKDALKALGIDGVTDKDLEKLKADKEKEKALKTLGLTQDQVDKLKGSEKTGGKTGAADTPKAESTSRIGETPKVSEPPKVTAPPVTPKTLDNVYSGSGLDRVAPSTLGGATPMTSAA